MTNPLTRSQDFLALMQGCADIDCAQVRLQIRQRVLGEITDIIDAAIRKAKEGHFQVIKYLFEVAGLHPQASDESAGEDLSLARALCDRLGLPPVPEKPVAISETESCGDSEQSSDHQNGHALK